MIKKSAERLQTKKFGLIDFHFSFRRSLIPFLLEISVRLKKKHSGIVERRMIFIFNSVNQTIEFSVCLRAKKRLFLPSQKEM